MILQWISESGEFFSPVQWFVCCLPNRNTLDWNKRMFLTFLRHVLWQRRRRYDHAQEYL